MSYLVYGLIVNALLGIAIFEWAWSKTYRYRNPNKEINDRFPMYRRNDAPEWSRLKFYPGAMTVLIPRMVIGILWFISLTIWLNVLMIGHKYDTPITGLRKVFLRLAYKVHVTTQAWLSLWTHITYKQISPEEVGHYEEYLGTREE